MRGTWQIACVLSALLWVGCSAPGEPTQPEMEEAPPPPVLAWPDVPCPSRSGFTARQRLDNIIQWSGGSPEDIERVLD